MDCSTSYENLSTSDQWWHSSSLSPEDLLNHSENWSLASDAATATVLHNISKKLVKKADEVKNFLSSTIEEADSVSVKISNVNASLFLLQNEQFIENKIPTDDDVSSTCHIKKVSDAINKDPLSNLKASIQNGIDLANKSYERIEISDSESNDGHKFGYKLIDPYEKRPLPHIIGSSLFHEDDTVGLLDVLSSSENEKQNESESEGSSSHLNPSIQDSRMLHSTKVELNSDSDSSDLDATRDDSSVKSFKSVKKESINDRKSIDFPHAGILSHGESKIESLHQEIRKASINTRRTKDDLIHSTDKLPSVEAETSQAHLERNKSIKAQHFTKKAVNTSSLFDSDTEDEDGVFSKNSSATLLGSNSTLSSQQSHKKQHFKKTSQTSLFDASSTSEDEGPGTKKDQDNLSPIPNVAIAQKSHVESSQQMNPSGSINIFGAKIADEIKKRLRASKENTLDSLNDDSPTSNSIPSKDGFHHQEKNICSKDIFHDNTEKYAKNNSSQKASSTQGITSTSTKTKGSKNLFSDSDDDLFVQKPQTSQSLVAPSHSSSILDTQHIKSAESSKNFHPNLEKANRLPPKTIGSADETKTQVASKAGSTVNLPQHQSAVKTKKKNLFSSSSSDEDLFSSRQQKVVASNKPPVKSILGEASKGGVAPSSAASVASNPNDVTVASSKPNWTVKPHDIKKSLFDSSSEDELFAPQKAIRIKDPPTSIKDQVVTKAPKRNSFENNSAPSHSSSKIFSQNESSPSMQVGTTSKATTHSSFKKNIFGSSSNSEDDFAATKPAPIAKIVQAKGEQDASQTSLIDPFQNKAKQASNEGPKAKSEVTLPKKDINPQTNNSESVSQGSPLFAEPIPSTPSSEVKQPPPLFIPPPMPTATNETKDDQHQDLFDSSDDDNFLISQKPSNPTPASSFIPPPLPNERIKDANNISDKKSSSTNIFESSSDEELFVPKKNKAPLLNPPEVSPSLVKTTNSKPPLLVKPRNIPPSTHSNMPKNLSQQVEVSSQINSKSDKFLDGLLTNESLSVAVEEIKVAKSSIDLSSADDGLLIPKKVTAPKTEVSKPIDPLLSVTSVNKETDRTSQSDKPSLKGQIPPNSLNDNAQQIHAIENSSNQSERSNKMSFQSEGVYLGNKVEESLDDANNQSSLNNEVSSSVCVTEQTTSIQRDQSIRSNNESVRKPIGGVKLFGGSELLSKINLRRKVCDDTEDLDEDLEQIEDVERHQKHTNPSNSIESSDLSLHSRLPNLTVEPSLIPTNEKGISFDESLSSKTLTSLTKDRPRVLQRRRLPSKLERKIPPEDSPASNNASSDQPHFVSTASGISITAPSPPNLPEVITDDGSSFDGSLQPTLVERVSDAEADFPIIEKETEPSSLPPNSSGNVHEAPHSVHISQSVKSDNIPPAKMASHILDESEDLFSRPSERVTPQLSNSKAMQQKSEPLRKKIPQRMSLFDDDEDEENLFKGKPISVKEKSPNIEDNTTKKSLLKADKTTLPVTKTKSLFSDDGNEDGPLFGTKAPSLSNILPKNFPTSAKKSPFTKGLPSSNLPGSNSTSVNKRNDLMENNHLSKGKKSDKKVPSFLFDDDEEDDLFCSSQGASSSKVISPQPKEIPARKLLDKMPKLAKSQDSFIDPLMGDKLPH